MTLGSLWICGRGALGDLHAVVEHGDALADAHHDFHRVLHEEDREAELLLDLLDQADELGFLGRVHAGRGLVQQEELRLCRQAADDLEAALLAVGRGSSAGASRNRRRSKISRSSSARRVIAASSVAEGVPRISECIGLVCGGGCRRRGRCRRR